MNNKDFVVKHASKNKPGVVTEYALNAHLAKGQKCTDEQMKILIGLHNAKLDLFDDIEYVLTDEHIPSAEVAKEWVDALAEIETEMQRNWNFPLDPNFHEWYLIPGCTCPTLDNMENRGTEYRVTHMDCIIHKAK